MKLSSHDKDDDGFTLLEMLIATIVISMIIVSSHTLLEQLMLTGRKLNLYNRVTTEFVRARTLLERDLQEIMIDKEHPLLAHHLHDDCTDDIVFYTYNMSNPDNAMRTSLRRINWYLRESVLIRKMTEGEITESTQVKFLPGVKCLQFRLYDGQRWRDITESQFSRPKGIAFKIIYKSDFSVEAIVPE
ncbi:prepilin-type N-terminal cleavage/methylation domain-containing protein [Salmonella enterica]